MFGKQKKRWLVAVAASLLAPTSVFAEITTHVNQLGRLFGAGWGDGYHACESSGHRLTADLPPRSYSQRGHQGPLKKLGTFYDQFDWVRSHHAGGTNGCDCDSLGCDAPGCDSLGYDAGGIMIQGSQVIQNPIMPPTQITAPTPTKAPVARPAPTNVPMAGPVLAPPVPRRAPMNAEPRLQHPVAQHAGSAEVDKPVAPVRLRPAVATPEPTPAPRRAVATVDRPQPIRPRGPIEARLPTAPKLTTTQRTVSPATSRGPRPSVQIEPTSSPDRTVERTTKTPVPIKPQHPGYTFASRADRLVRAALGDNFKMPARPSAKNVASRETIRAKAIPDPVAAQRPRQAARTTKTPIAMATPSMAALDLESLHARSTSTAINAPRGATTRIAKRSERPVAAPTASATKAPAARVAVAPSAPTVRKATPDPVAAQPPRHAARMTKTPIAMATPSMAALDLESLHARSPSTAINTPRGATTRIAKRSERPVAAPTASATKAPSAPAVKATPDPVAAQPPRHAARMTKTPIAMATPSMAALDLESLHARSPSTSNAPRGATTRIAQLSERPVAAPTASATKAPAARVAVAPSAPAEKAVQSETAATAAIKTAPNKPEETSSDANNSEPPFQIDRSFMPPSLGVAMPRSVSNLKRSMHLPASKGFRSKGLGGRHRSGNGGLTASIAAKDFLAAPATQSIGSRPIRIDGGPTVRINPMALPRATVELAKRPPASDSPVIRQPH